MVKAGALAEMVLREEAPAGVAPGRAAGCCARGLGVKTGTSSSSDSSSVISVALRMGRETGRGASLAAEALSASASFSIMPCLLMPAPSLTPISLATLRSSTTDIFSNFSLIGSSCLLREIIRKEKRRLLWGRMKNRLITCGGVLVFSSDHVRPQFMFCDGFLFCRKPLMR